jgi:MSHA biogenesis protein MshI
MEGRVFGLLKKTAAARGRVGLAWQGGQLAIAVVRYDSGGAAILERCELLPLTDADAADRYRLALQGAGLPPMPISCALQSDDYQLVQVEAPDVPPAELRAAMRWRLKDLIDIRIDDAVIDVFAVPTQARGTQGKMMYAVAAQRSVIEAMSARLANQPLFDVVDIPELCLRNVLARSPAAKGGVALLHLAEGTASVVIVRDRTFFFSRKMTLQSAMDRDADSSADAVPIDAASVVLELQRSLDYYERHFDQPPITRLLVAPLDPRAQTLAIDLARDTGLEVAMLDLNSLLTCATPIPPEAQAAVLFAVGAALRDEQRTL